jgi:hypothetical protein
MPTNLTGFQINSTYRQLLHISDGPTATEKTVFSGTGVATALSLGTQSMSGTFSAITFLNQAAARTSMGLGSIATQSANNVAITGGTVTNVTFTGSFTGITLIDADKFTTKAGTDGISLQDNSIFAEGVSTNLDISLTPKGTGSVNITKVNITAGTVPYNTITGRAYAAFSDITDQTGSTTVPAPVKFGTTEVAGAGITMVTDGTNLTRLTFAAAGTYAVMPNLQLSNTDSNDHDAVIWFALDGANIARSTTRVTVPKTSEGGNAFFQIIFYVTVTAGQYIQLYWLPENTAVTLDHTAAVTGPPAIPATPSAIMTVERIA